MTVRITGVGMSPFGRFLEQSMKETAAVAVRQALEDSGIGIDDVGLFFVGNAAAGTITGQEMIKGQVLLRPMGVSGTEIVNVENACASASTALRLGRMAIQAGEADVVLVLGAEKLTHQDKAVSFGAFGKAIDVEAARAARAAAKAAAAEQDSEAAAGGSPVPKRSVFMDIYADSVRRHMALYGTTREQIAAAAAKASRFGALNPDAQYRKALTVEEILSSRMVADPLTVPMCAPIGDGAAAAVLMSDREARRRGLVDRPRILASVLVSGSAPGDDFPPAEHRAGSAAYEQAGLGPDELDVAEVHDAAAPAELIAYEALQFCAKGESGPLIESGATDLGGKLVVNPSGGLVARGHPIGATGLAQIVELVRQLRGLSGDRQVHGARIALAQNGGGFLENDSAAQAVHILEAGR